MQYVFAQMVEQIEQHDPNVNYGEYLINKIRKYIERIQLDISIERRQN